MTRAKTITECLEAWEFYAKTGTADKSDYLPAREIYGTCFFCEYVVKKRGTTCEKDCPAWGYWTSSNKFGYGSCLADTTTKRRGLFRFWEKAKTKADRQLWAGRIVWMVWLIQQGQRMERGE